MISLMQALVGVGGVGGVLLASGIRQAWSGFGPVNAAATRFPCHGSRPFPQRARGHHGVAPRGPQRRQVPGPSRRASSVSTPPRWRVTPPMDHMGGMVRGNVCRPFRSRSMTAYLGPSGIVLIGALLV